MHIIAPPEELEEEPWPWGSGGESCSGFYFGLDISTQWSISPPSLLIVGCYQKMITVHGYICVCVCMNFFGILLLFDKKKQEVWSALF